MPVYTKFSIDVASVGSIGSTGGSVWSYLLSGPTPELSSCGLVPLTTVQDPTSSRTAFLRIYFRILYMESTIIQSDTSQKSLDRCDEIIQDLHDNGGTQVPVVFMFKFVTVL